MNLSKDDSKWYTAYLWDSTYSDASHIHPVKIISSKIIDLQFETDNEYVIYNVTKLAEVEDFSRTDQCMVATAASELATNIIRYAKRGRIIVRVIEEANGRERGIEIIADDKGPGIYNMDFAMKEHNSTMENSLGFGLSSVKRIMDEFFISTEVGGGTVVLVRKWGHEIIKNK